MGSRIRWIVSLIAVAAFSNACDVNDPSPTVTPAPVPSSPNFTSQAFSVPFTVTVPASLKPQPSEDTTNLISWGAVTGDNGVRFLHPVAVYYPDGTTPQPAPKDYPSYLSGLVDAGATFVDRTTTTVNGQEATLMTGTTTRALDGTLGCPAATTPVEVCFGLQPDVALRIAVVDLDGKTLIAWARTQQDDANAAQFFAEFEAMLRSLQLS